MKKKLLAAAIMAALTLSASAALAAPTFSGDAQLLTQKSATGNTFNDVRFRLNADAQIGDGMYAHGRLMGIDMPNYAKAGGGVSGATVQMEQMYLGAKVGAVDVKIGRQPLGLGGQGLVADMNGLEGISLANATGDFNVSGFVGRSDETDRGNGVRDTVAGSIGTKFDGINFGTAYMKTNDDKGINKYWSVSADTKVANNVTLGGEYINNTSADASGFLVKATIGEIAKKGDINYAVSYRNIEDRAVDADWVTNGAYANSKGFRLATNYKVNDNATLSLYQDITKTHDTNTKVNQFRAELDVNF